MDRACLRESSRRIYEQMLASISDVVNHGTSPSPTRGREKVWPKLPWEFQIQEYRPVRDKFCGDEEVDGFGEVEAGEGLEQCSKMKRAGRSLGGGRKWNISCSVVGGLCNGQVLMLYSPIALH